MLNNAQLILKNSFNAVSNFRPNIIFVNFEISIHFAIYNVWPMITIIRADQIPVINNLYIQVVLDQWIFDKLDLYIHKYIFIFNGII